MFYIREIVAGAYSYEPVGIKIVEFNTKREAIEYGDVTIQKAEELGFKIESDDDPFAYIDADVNRHMLFIFPSLEKKEPGEKFELVETLYDDDEEYFSQVLAVFSNCPTHKEFVKILKDKFGEVDVADYLAVRVNSAKYEIRKCPKEPIHLDKFSIEALDNNSLKW